MTNYYKSQFYSKPIEVEDIDWEKIVSINDNKDRKIIYSWYNLEEKNTWSIYINKCLLWGFIRKIPKDVLIIWFWGWTYAKYLEDHILNINITWIDIDEAMIEISKKEFWIKTNDIYILDASKALNQIINKKIKYDLILIDVYWWDWEIPNYFKEELFFKQIKKVLQQDWVISINYADYYLDDKEKTNKYNKIHSNIINIFWKYYSHLLTWEDNRWNVSWIYNLTKNYTAKEYDINYMNKYKNWEIEFDSNIIKNTVLDKQKKRI